MLSTRNFSSCSNMTISGWQCGWKDLCNVLCFKSALALAGITCWSDLRTVSVPYEEHSEGNQWHSANLFEQTWLKMSEHNCSLYPCWWVCCFFFWFCGGSSALTFHQVQVHKNEGRKKTHKTRIIIFLSVEHHIFNLFLLWESKGKRNWGDT